MDTKTYSITSECPSITCRLLDCRRCFHWEASCFSRSRLGPGEATKVVCSDFTKSPPPPRRVHGNSLRCKKPLGPEIFISLIFFLHPKGWSQKGTMSQIHKWKVVLPYFRRQIWNTRHSVIAFRARSGEGCTPIRFLEHFCEGINVPFLHSFACYIVF